MVGNSLFLNITNPQLYTSGSKVEGIAQVLVKDRLNLEAVEVELFGLAKSKNYQYNNGVRLSGQESHKLLHITNKVFPPPHVQNVAMLKSYTLTSGRYNYPFEFVFPGKEHVIQCVKDKKILHKREYLWNERRYHATLPGSFFDGVNLSDYCFVQYSVKARVKMALSFRFNIKQSVPIYFAPRNSDSFFSLLSLCDASSKDLLPDESHACKKVKYAIDSDLKKNKSFLRLLFSSNAVEVPFDLNVRFKEVIPIETEKGTTNRVLQAGSRLSRFVDLDLSTSFSYLNLMDALGMNKLDKRGSVPPPAIKFTHIEIKLLLTVRYQGTRESVLESSFVLRKHPLELQVDLSDFEKVENYSPLLSKKSPSKYSEKLDENVCYRLSLDRSWWDCYVSDIGQTFMLCNIHKTARLYICLRIASAGNPAKERKIENTSPIVFYRQEGPDAPLYNQVEHLPRYMPAPADYDDDSMTDEKG